MNKRIILIAGIVAALVVVVLLTKKPLSEKYNKKGVENFDSLNYPEAEKYFKKALAWKRRSPEILINIIKAELAQEKIDETEDYVIKLAELSPENPETYGLKGQILVKYKQYKEAVELLSMAIEKDSLLAYAYFYRGISRANLGDLNGAAEDYLKAQQYDRANIEALEERAVVLSKLQDFDALIDNYNAMIAVDPSNTNAYLERGNFKMKIEDYESAVSDFSQVITLNQKLGEAYFNRGRSYAKLEMYDKARMDFDKSAELNFKKPGAFYNAGLASLKMEDVPGANAYLFKVISADDTGEYSAKANYLLGVSEMMKGKNANAIDFFNTAIELNSEYADAYYNRGIAYGLIDQHAEALSDLEKCLNLGRKTADLYFAMGVQRIALNNFPEGCSDLKTAAEMGSEQAANMRKQYCTQY